MGHESPRGGQTLRLRAVVGNVVGIHLACIGPHIAQEREYEAVEAWTVAMMKMIW